MATAAPTGGGTNLQVNANTGQAVGQFNALAQAIQNAQNGFAALANQMASNVSIGQRLSSSLSGTLSSAFDRLSSIVGGLLKVLGWVYSGMELIFSSLLKEMDKIQGFNSMMLVSSKSAQVAADSYDFVRQTANRMGIQFDAVANNYSKLLAAIPDGNTKFEETRKVFLGVAAAARALHASNQDTNLMFYAVTQIASKGIVSMEELRRQLGEKVPGVMQILAKALSTTPELLEAAIRKGIVVSEKFLPILGEAFLRTFGDAANNSADSVSASMNRLKNVWVDFAKEILDSGAGKSIVGVFDALREKLSDPYVIKRFSEIIKDMADQIGNFIRNLSQDDLRKGFDSFAHGLQIMLNLLIKAVDLIQWMINNAPKVGAIGGALAGAMVVAPIGAAAGAPFAGVGAVPGAMAGGGLGALAGGILGFKGGQQVAPTEADLQRIAEQDKKAAIEAARAAIAKQQYADIMVQVLDRAYGLKKADVPKLFTPDRLNQETLDAIGSAPFKERDRQGKLLYKQGKMDPATNQYVASQEQINAVRDFAKYGEWLSPGVHTMDEVLGGGKAKRDVLNEHLKDTVNKYVTEAAGGLSSTFNEEWDRLTILFREGWKDEHGKSHKISTAELELGQKRLLADQPFAKKLVSEDVLDTKDIDKFLNSYVKIKLEMEEQFALEQRIAGMSREDRTVEQDMFKYTEKFRKANIDLSEEQLEKMREEIKLTEEIKRLQSIKEGLLAQGPDRLNKTNDFVKSITQLQADKSKNYSSEDARIALSTNADTSEIMLATDVATKAIERKYGDMYATIRRLRRENLISEQEAKTAEIQLQEESKRATIQSELDRMHRSMDLGSGNTGTRISLAQSPDLAPIFSTTTTAIDALTKRYQQMFADIDLLQKRGVVTATEANRAKLGLVEDLRQKSIQAQIDLSNQLLTIGQGSWADGILSILGKLQAGFTTFSVGATAAFTDFFQKFEDGFANSVGRSVVYSENLNQALTKISQEAIAGLISALVKLGIQWVINKTLGQAMGATTSANTITAITEMTTLGSVAGTEVATLTEALVVAAATVAESWAPAAAMVSLASFGANSVPAIEGILATSAVAQGAALMGSYDTGGYTGDFGRKQVAGVVHGKEFVMNADSTAKYRPILEAMNDDRFNLPGFESGGYVGSSGYTPLEETRSARSNDSNSNSTSGNMTVLVENHGADITREESTKPNGDRQVKLIIKAAAAEVVRQIGVGGPVSKALRESGVDMRGRLPKRG